MSGTHVGVPMAFCLALALELAVKAVLVAQGKLAELRPGERIAVAGHDLPALARLIAGLELTAEEEECLQTAKEMIVDGRYPCPLVPKDQPARESQATGQSFRATAEDLYGKFSRHAVGATGVIVLLRRCRIA